MSDTHPVRDLERPWPPPARPGPGVRLAVFRTIRRRRGQAAHAGEERRLTSISEADWDDLRRRIG
ncbi:MAG: hypothetical protein ACOCXJ_01915 [Planctomycetota bacterium]